MALSVKNLTPGDLLISNINEVYCYLGFYVGEPRSMYDVPDFGHMYLFCDSLSFLISRFSAYSALVKDQVQGYANSGGMISQQASAEIIQYNWCRLRRSFDGNARYTKSPAKFECMLGRCDILDRETSLAYVYDCKRLGDRKPRGFKEPEW